ncbi:MAG TPA: type II secretion system protein GspG [Planctomycetota bacterium]|nr:type II secretion system protein GspG [Planctomycetota bacterium]
MKSLLLWSLLSGAAFCLQDATPEGLIEQLGNDQAETRDAALKELRRKGEAARAALDQAFNHADPQVRAAVRSLLSQLNDRVAAEKRQQLARKAALLLKPAFDAIEAGGKEVANQDGKRYELKPLEGLGLKGDFFAVWTFNVPSADLDLALRNSLRQGASVVGKAPAEVFPFEDLSLTCWSLPEGGGGVVTMAAGWLFFRRLGCSRWRMHLDPQNGTHGFTDYRVQGLLVHVRKIGDLDYSAPPIATPEPPSWSAEAEKLVLTMNQKIWAAKRGRVQVDGRSPEGAYQASILLSPAKEPHPFYARSFVTYEESKARVQSIWGGGVPFFKAEGIEVPRRPRCIDLNSNARSLLTHLGVYPGIHGGHLSYREREGMMNTLEGQFLPDHFELKGEEKIGARAATVIQYRLAVKGSTAVWRVQLWMDPDRMVPIRRIYTTEQGKTITEEYARFDLDEDVDESPLAASPVQSESERTASLIDFTAALLEVYRTYNNGQYPERLDALAPEKKGTWIQDYLKDYAPLKDAWGRPFQYRMPGTQGRRYDLGSLGADGREGGTGADADLWHD